jgi:hypothetical protein
MAGMATRLAVLLGIAALYGCGGAAAESGNGPAAAPGEAPGVAVADEPTRASSGTAGRGEACDYGGADRFTCGGGLECCYGEHARPDGYGSCQAECNWD